MSAKGEQAAAAAEVVAWRVIDADGRPATDWIDGDGRGREPFVAGGRVQLAYASAERARVPDWLPIDVRNEADSYDPEFDLTTISMLKDFADLLESLTAVPSQPDAEEVER